MKLRESHSFMAKGGGVELAILILLIVSLVFNILVSIVLVRSREALEEKMDRQTKDGQRLSQDVQRLIQELMVRLPPRPYGVNIEDRYQNMSIGPRDDRIPY